MTTSRIVGLVAFVSLTLLPWVLLFVEVSLQKLVAAGLIWLMIGTFAVANDPRWRKKQP